MNTDEMPAGRELDALVAEKVMGFCLCPYDPKWMRADTGSGIWIDGDTWRCTDHGKPAFTPWRSYSTDIAAAWEVVEKMREDYEPRIELWDEGWEVTILTGTDRGSASGRALTAPLAICRAALKAV